MGWRFRKSLKLGPVRLNVGKKGVGYSVGGKGVRIGRSSRGARYVSASVRGTGWRYYKEKRGTGGGCLPVLLVPLASMLFWRIAF